MRTGRSLNVSLLTANGVKTTLTFENVLANSLKSEEKSPPLDLKEEASEDNEDNPVNGFDRLSVGLKKPGGDLHQGKGEADCLKDEDEKTSSGDGLDKPDKPHNGLDMLSYGLGSPGDSVKFFLSLSMAVFAGNDKWRCD